MADQEEERIGRRLLQHLQERVGCRRFEIIRGVDLETRLGSLPMPTWFLELPSLLDQVQAETDQARASARDLLVALGTPLGTD